MNYYSLQRIVKKIADRRIAVHIANSQPLDTKIIECCATNMSRFEYLLKSDVLSVSNARSFSWIVSIRFNYLQNVRIASITPFNIYGATWRGDRYKFDYLLQNWVRVAFIFKWWSEEKLPGALARYRIYLFIIFERSSLGSSCTNLLIEPNIFCHVNRLKNASSGPFFSLKSDVITISNARKYDYSLLLH